MWDKIEVLFAWLSVSSLVVFSGGMTYAFGKALWTGVVSAPTKLRPAPVYHVTVDPWSYSTTVFFWGLLTGGLWVLLWHVWKNRKDIFS